MHVTCGDKTRSRCQRPQCSSPHYVAAPTLGSLPARRQCRWHRELHLGGVTGGINVERPRRWRTHTYRGLPSRAKARGHGRGGILGVERAGIDERLRWLAPPKGRAIEVALDGQARGHHLCCLWRVDQSVAIPTSVGHPRREAGDNLAAHSVLPDFIRRWQRGRASGGRRIAAAARGESEEQQSTETPVTGHAGHGSSAACPRLACAY
jgi:hypothetical protein